jgi:hypothetical protein
MAFAFQGRTQIRSVRWLRQLQSNALHDVCRHLDRTNAFSVDGGCGGFKRDRVASHANTFQPKEQGTRDLGDLFEEGLRKERERMIALIKEAYGLAYEAMQMQKFYSLNPAVVASELRRATRPTAAPRYSVSSIVIAQSRQTLNLWLACMHVPEFKAGLSVQVARGRAQPHALRHAAYVVVSSVRSALRGWSHLIAPNDCCTMAGDGG